MNAVNDQRVNELVAQMTLEEKAALVAGADSWNTAEIGRFGIPSVMMTDGPHGLRKEINPHGNEAFATGHPATCFPTASALACSFDTELLGQVGQALGREAAAAGVSVVLGPGINIKRSPLCGRNFEYFSEDPLLAGSLGAAYIKGMQSVGVGACLKHFAMNNREYARFVSSSNADSRTMHELYLRAFEIAVRESKPYSVMSSYNMVNGKYVGESKELLTDLLRNEWGFDGTVISDWGAVCDRAASIKAGLDLEMPGGYKHCGKRVLDAVKKGQLAESELNTAVQNILRLVFKCKENGEGFESQNTEELFRQNNALAEKAAAASAVLLKNEEDILPFSEKQPVAVIGRMAKWPRYQGAGSSHVNSIITTNLLEALDSRNLDYRYSEGYTENGETDRGLIARAVATAKECRKVLIVAGLPDEYESEGYDRTSMSLPEGMNELISAVAAVNPNCVVALQLGSPVELPFADRVKGIVACYLGGQAGGGGLADILFGRINPSARLAETWPCSLDQLPNGATYLEDKFADNYYEGIYCGYRYFDAVGVEPLFPFGHGLSYSKFKMGSAALSKESVSVGDSLSVTVSVTNASERPGTETLLVFAKGTDCKKLVGFAKLSLAAGETGEAVIPLSVKDMGYYNSQTHEFCLEEGEYTLSVEGMTAKAACTVKAERGVRPPQYLTPVVGMGNKAQWQSIYGKTPALRVVRPYTLNSTLDELRESAVGRVVFNAAKKSFCKGKSPQEVDNLMKFALDMPLRALVSLSGGAMELKLAQSVVQMANGHWLKGIKHLF